MRDLSENIEAVRLSKSHNVWLAIDITLANDTVIRASEAEITVTSINLLGTSVNVDPVTYEAQLNENITVGFSKTSQRNFDVSILDLQHYLSVLVSQIESILEDAKIVVTTCWEKQDGTYEADIYFVGKIEACTATTKETSISFTSDYNSRNATVANRILTQHCIAILGDNKCRKPAHLLEEGETCSNVFDDAENGCLAKKWQFAFFGVPILRLRENYNLNNGWGISGGFSGGGGGLIEYRDYSGCPVVGSFAQVLKSKEEIIAVKVENLVLGCLVLDGFGNANIVDALDIIKDVRCFEIKTKSGAILRCSYDHPIIRNFIDKKGTKTEAIILGDTAVCYDFEKKKNFTDSIVSISEIGRLDVVRITLGNKTNALYLCGQESNMAILGHNNKREYEINFDNDKYFIN